MESQILELNRKLQSKEISSVELTQEVLAKAETIGKELNCFNSIDRDFAISQAEQIDSENNFQNNILSGIPTSVKDVIVTKDFVSTGSSKMLENYKPQYNAAVVENLLEAGAVIFGKNNSDPFAFGASGENSGFGITHNPVCTNRIPGGSSSGSAAAVAAGIGLYSIGTDTGGSIRQPASMTGIVGLKASYGRNSRYGLMAMGSSWDTPGILANNVVDTWIAQNFLQGFDPKDGTSSSVNNLKLNSAEVLKKIEEIKKSLAGKKIGIPAEYFPETLDPDIRQVILDSIRMYESLGCELVDISLPYSKYAIPVYYTLVPTEISSNLARLDGIRYGGLEADLSTAKSLEEYYLENRALFEPEVKRRALLGTYISAKGVSKNYYQKAMQVRNLIKQDFDKAFESVDVIMTPVSPTVAWEIGTKNDDPVFNYLADIFTTTVNCAGIPAISIPAGFKVAKSGETFGNNFEGKSCDKLPIGLQIIGKMFREDEVCNFAWHFENSKK